MAWIAWLGFLIGSAGLAGLIYCMIKAWRARKSSRSDDELRKVLNGLLPINLASLGIAAVGLGIAAFAILM